MGDFAGVKGGCKNRLMVGAYRAMSCRMPCNSTDAKVKRAIYNELKGTEQACPLKNIYVIKPLDAGDTDLYVRLEPQKGLCNFGWGCRRSTSKATRKVVSKSQPVEQWREVVKLFLMPIQGALKFLASIL